MFSAAALAVGETLLEPGESLTRALKNAPTARGNVWLHRGGVFFHARSLDENGAMRDVSVYQMADGGLKIITAASARLQDGGWRLADGEESHLSAEGSAARVVCGADAGLAAVGVGVAGADSSAAGDVNADAGAGGGK